jgi:hypothetical protein
MKMGLTKEAAMKICEIIGKLLTVILLLCLCGCGMIDFAVYLKNLEKSEPGVILKL